MPSGNTTKSPALTTAGLHAAHLPVGVTVTCPLSTYADSLPEYCQSNFETSQPQVPHLLMPWVCDSETFTVQASV